MIRMSLKDLPCAGCGKLMWNSSTSAPAGLATCIPCRRAAHGLASDQRVARVGPTPRTTKRCANCGNPFSGKGSHRYCSTECGRRVRSKTRYGDIPVNTTHRGYGAKHQRIREATIGAAYDTPCHFCGEFMLVGQALHLDHTEDGAEYRGFAHARCNQRDGGLRGNERRRQLVLYRAGVISELPAYASVRKAAPPPPKRVPKPTPSPRLDDWRVCVVCRTLYIATTVRQVVCSQDCRTERNRTVARERYRDSGKWQGGTWSSTRTFSAPRRNCVRCHASYIATGSGQKWCTKECHASSMQEARAHVVSSVKKTNGLTQIGKLDKNKPEILKILRLSATQRTCAHCHATYISTHSARRWCSEACRVTAKREEKDYAYYYARRHRKQQT